MPREAKRAASKFELGDIDALLAEVYVDATTRFIGNRCDTAPNRIQRDANGRIVRQPSGGCQGLNAGSLLIVLADRMKDKQLPVAIDAQNDFNTDQIWNQPAYRYTVNRFESLSEAEAANLVGSGRRDGALTEYTWDTAARGFAFVDITLEPGSPSGGPNLAPGIGLPTPRARPRMVAVLELDDAASNADAKIIGGEYLDDSSVGADRLTVPPFVWVAEGPGPEDLAKTVNGDHHNPYVKPSVVAQLVEIGQR